MIDYWLLFTMNIMVYTLAFHTFLQVQISNVICLKSLFHSIPPNCLQKIMYFCENCQKRVKDEAAEGGFQESGDILKQRHGRIALVAFPQNIWWFAEIMRHGRNGRIIHWKYVSRQIDIDSYSNGPCTLCWTIHTYSWCWNSNNSQKDVWWAGFFLKLLLVL